MVPSDTADGTADAAAAQTAREFADRFAAGAFADDGLSSAAFADAADLLTEDGRERVVESFSDDPWAESLVPEDAIERYWWGLYGQYGDVESVSVAGVEDDVVTVEFACAAGTQAAEVTVDGDGVTDLAFPTSYEEPDYVDEAAFAEREVTVDAGDLGLDGVLAVPEGDGPFPGVVLVHGAGIHDPDGTVGASKILRDFGRGLASQGVATLRYEKRPNATDLAPEDHDLDTLVVEDAVAALGRLAAVDEVSADALFVAGHSQGGMCAPRIADCYDGAVAGVVSLDGPTAKPVEPDDAEEWRYRMEPDGDLSEEQEAMLEDDREDLARIASGDFEADDTVLGSPGALWQSRQALDPVGTAADLDAAVFAACTGRVDEDLQTPLVDVIRGKYERWQDAATTDADRVVYYEGVGHYFQEGPVPVKMAYLDFGGNVAEYVVDDLAEWVHDVAGT